MAIGECMLLRKTRLHCNINCSTTGNLQWQPNGRVLLLSAPVEFGRRLRARNCWQRLAAARNINCSLQLQLRNWCSRARHKSLVYNLLLLLPNAFCSSVESSRPTRFELLRLADSASFLFVRVCLLVSLLQPVCLLRDSLSK